MCGESETKTDRIPFVAVALEESHEMNDVLFTQLHSISSVWL